MRASTSLLLTAGLASALTACGHGCKRHGKEHGTHGGATASACERARTHELDTIVDPITAHLYVTPGVKPIADRLAEVRKLLDAYVQASKGKLEYTVIEVREHDTATEAEAQGLVAVPQLKKDQTEADLEADPSKGQPAFLGLTLRLAPGSGKAAEAALPYIDRMDDLDYMLTRTLHDLRMRAQGKMRSFALIRGHGETLPADALLAAPPGGAPGPKVTFEQVWGEAFAGTHLVPATLKDDAVIAQADGIVLLQPQRAYGDDDLKAIDRLVTSGKPLVVLAGAANLTRGDATMTVTLDDHGLDKLLAGYGIEIDKNVVLDWEHSMAVMAQGPSGSTRQALPQFLSVIDSRGRTPDPPLLNFLGLGRTMLAMTSSLTLHPEKQPAAHFVTIARSGPHADVLTQSGGSLSPFDGTALRPIPAPANGKSYVLGAYVEGPLVSAFAPAGTAASGRGRGRVLVIASPYLLANPLAQAAAGDAPSPASGILEQLSGRYVQEAVESMVYTVKQALDWTGMDPDVLTCGGPKE